MRYRLYVILFCIFWCAPIFAQANFTERINIGMYSPARSVAFMDDGGYLVGGYYAKSINRSPTIPFLASIDKVGNVRWVESLLTDGTVAHVAPAGDGSYYATGTVNDFGILHTYVMRLDSLGQEIWVRAIQINDVTQVSGFCVAKDGGCFIAQSFDNNGMLYAIKFGPDGTVDWRTTLPESHVEILAATTLNDGDLVCTGFSKLGVGTAPIVILSSNGNLLRYEEFPTDRAHEAIQGNGITATQDGGFAIAGTSSGSDALHDAFVQKFDSSGKALWSTVVDLFDDEGGMDIIETSKGEFEIVGFSQTSINVDTFARNSAMFLKCSSDGQILNSSLQSFPQNDLAAFGMAHGTDGTIMIVGFAGDSGSQSESGGMLLESYSETRAPCNLVEVLNSVHPLGRTDVISESVDNNVTDTTITLELDSALITYRIDLCALNDVPYQATSQNEITLYPNPLPKDAPLNFNIPIGWPGGEYELSISDITGNIIKHEKISLAGTSAPLKYDLASLASGAYILSLASKSEPAMKRSVKFVKE